uniref:Uncharacterized protein n=1 Tax=Oryza sativa subsp. japonica TaxID=39947 RepID=Q5Z6T1_ORYSJ|nr:hypothetical protein [Oryza sativa Japonica Group]BAD54338.1 hypothetical protein [Oryza sativa Japonica Group]
MGVGAWPRGQTSVCVRAVAVQCACMRGRSTSAQCGATGGGGHRRAAKQLGGGGGKLKGDDDVFILLAVLHG